MIEVIGKDTSVQRQVTCRECASILKFANADTYVREYRDYTGDLDRVRELKCPVCSNVIGVRL